MLDHPLGPMKKLQSGMIGTAEFKGKLASKSLAQDTDKVTLGHYLPVQEYDKFNAEYTFFLREWNDYMRMLQIIECIEVKPNGVQS